MIVCGAGSAVWVSAEARRKTDRAGAVRISSTDVVVSGLRVVIGAGAVVVIGAGAVVVIGAGAVVVLGLVTIL